MADMKAIPIVSTSTVRAASGDHGGEHCQRMELSPSDLIQLQSPYMRRGLLFHKPKSNTIEIVQRMKIALSRALEIFFPLAGRLAEIKDSDDTQTTSFFIDCNGEGVLFVHSIADIYTVGDSLGSLPDEIFSSLFPMKTVFSYEAADSKLPLLAVQVTELADRVFVAWSMNHVAADGTTFWHFLNVWSEISCLGDKALPQRPVFGREYLNGLVDLPVRVPLSFLQTPVLPAVMLQSRVIHFSKEKIAELKAKANSVKTGSYVISSLQAVMAHLWVCATRSRGLSPETLVRYGFAVGLRQRLDPPLSDLYFGNAIMLVTVSATVGELLDRGMIWAARQFNLAIATITPAEARKFLENPAETIRPLSETLKQGRPAHVIIAGSSPRFDVYGNHFGFGRPITVRGPVTAFERSAAVVRGPEEGSMDFDIILRPETFCALANDPEFAGTLAK